MSKAEYLVHSMQFVVCMVGKVARTRCLDGVSVVVSFPSSLVGF